MPRFLLAALAWAVWIGVLCLTPSDAIPSWEWADLLSVDKMVHAVMFGVLTALLARGLRDRKGNERPDLQLLLLAGAASVGYGGLMELLQGIPGSGRQGDWVDMTANTVGAVLGIFWTRRRWNRQRHTIHA